jgi:hypothetical protein
VSATSESAQKVFAAHAITGFGGEKIFETSDERDANPNMLNIDHLLSMAKHEIDNALASVFAEKT